MPTAVMAGPSAEPSQAVMAAPAAGLPAEPSQRGPGRMTPLIAGVLPIGTRRPARGSGSRQTAQPSRTDAASAATKAIGLTGAPGPGGRTARPAEQDGQTRWPAGQLGPALQQADRITCPAGPAGPMPLADAMRSAEGPAPRLQERADPMPAFPGRHPGSNRLPSAPWSGAEPAGPLKESAVAARFAVRAAGAGRA